MTSEQHCNEQVLCREIAAFFLRSLRQEWAIKDFGMELMRCSGHISLITDLNRRGITGFPSFFVLNVSMGHFVGSEQKQSLEAAV